MSDHSPRFAALADIAEGHALVGSRWEPRFRTTTIDICVSESAAYVALAEFRSHDPVGEGRTYRNLRVWPYPPVGVDLL